MFHHIEFFRDDRKSGEPVIVRIITDISINLETAKARALALFPEMQQKGAATFLIRNTSGAELYRWRPGAAGIARVVHETGGRARANSMLGAARRH